MAFWSVRRMVSFEKLDSASLIDSIRGALLGKILSGELRPGDRLPAERDMAAQLGVSRSSLHHAVLQLETQGFLKIEPRRGTVVADYRKHPTPSSLSALVGYGSLEIDEPLFHDFMDARSGLETGSARRACRGIYESTFDEMSSIASRIAPGAEDLPGMIYRYHYLLTQASGNSLFSMMFRAFEPVLTTLITAYYTRPDADIAAEAALHRELLDHIRARDEDAAADCAERLLRIGMDALGMKYRK